MPRHGFLRVAAASPEVRVADCSFNAERHIELLERAESEGVDLVVFPELSLTGYTCGDLFHQKKLQDAALTALESVLSATQSGYRGLYIVGLPVVVEGKLFNAAAVCIGAQILSLVPKTYLPNYKEFYDARYFYCGGKVSEHFLYTNIVGQTVQFQSDNTLAGELPGFPSARFGVEICEDLWTPIPPSSKQALNGAGILCNLSASNETVGKYEYRRQLVAQQSARCIAGYIYAGAGVGESTQDIVFGGHCLIAENGVILAESERFARKGSLIVADIDLDRIQHERIQNTSFHKAPSHEFERGITVVRPDVVPDFRTITEHIPWTRVVEERKTVLDGQAIDMMPFVLVNKDRFVLKPNDDYGGKGIVLGWTVDQSQWADAVKTALASPYVVQQRVNLPWEPYPSMHEGKVHLIDRMLDTNPYVAFGQYMHGCLTRISTDALVNVTAGGGSTVPTFLIERR